MEKLVRKYVELEEKVSKQEEEIAEIKAMLQEILQLLRGAEASKPEEIEVPESEEEKEKQGEGVDSPAPETTVEQEPTEPEEEQKKKPTVDDPDKQEKTEPAPNLEKEAVETPRSEAVEKGEPVEAKETYGYEEVLKEVLAPLSDPRKRPLQVSEISEKLRKMK